MSGLTTVLNGSFVSMFRRHDANLGSETGGLDILFGGLLKRTSFDYRVSSELTFHYAPRTQTGLTRLHPPPPALSSKSVHLYPVPGDPLFSDDLLHPTKNTPSLIMSDGTQSAPDLCRSRRRAPLQGWGLVTRDGDFTQVDGLSFEGYSETVLRQVG